MVSRVRSCLAYWPKVIKILTLFCYHFQVPIISECFKSQYRRWRRLYYLGKSSQLSTSICHNHNIYRGIIGFIIDTRPNIRGIKSITLYV